VDGHSYELTPQEVEVRLAGREGWAVASDPDYVVALSTTLTDALKREGLARELVRQYNDLRKTAGLRVEDQMRATWSGSDVWAQVVAEHGDYIRQETLAAELTRADNVPEGAHGETVTFEGSTITVSVRAAEVAAAPSTPFEHHAPVEQAAAPAAVRHLVKLRTGATQPARSKAGARKPATVKKATKPAPRKAVKRVTHPKSTAGKPAGKPKPARKSAALRSAKRPAPAKRARKTGRTA